jgi:hypothetical protein
MNDNRPLKLLALFPGLLFAAFILSAVIYRDHGSGWAGQLANLTCASLLVLPAAYLLVAPGLALELFNLGRTKLFSGTNWQRLADREKWLAILLAGLCLLGGIYLLGRIFWPLAAAFFYGPRAGLQSCPAAI